jgi:hypothetical protein
MAEAITQPVLSAGPAEHILLDYAALRADAIKELERLTDTRWTDFNAHDPGITILEALCYALTDFGYRLFHPLPDLLTPKPGEVAPPSVFAGPIASLSCRAVTVDDLRAAAIDVPGVRNAWVEPALPPLQVPLHDPAKNTLELLPSDQPTPDGSTRLALKGLWRVLVEPEGGVLPNQVEADVAARLHGERALGEDFAEILVLGEYGVKLDLAIELTPDAQGEAVLNAIGARFDAYFSPTIPRRSAAEVLALGDPAALVEGPMPRRGLPDRAALAAARRHRAIYRSDLIREAMAVPGVAAVRHIIFMERKEHWSLPIPDDRVPVLDRAASIFAVFSPGGDLVTIPFKRPTSAKTRPALRGSEMDRAPAAGRWRNPAAFRPIAADLPPTYAVGEGTLTASAPVERRVAASRLRGYLGIFDIILAGHFAQLAELPTLFGAGGGAKPYPVGDVQELLPHVNAPKILPDSDDLRGLVEKEDAADALRRRNALLNHLLARFGEDLPNDPLAEELITRKEAFLQALPMIGGSRGGGVDLLALPNEASDPPLVRRIMVELGLSVDEKLVDEKPLLLEHILLRPQPGDVGQPAPKLDLVARADPFSLQVTVVLPKIEPGNTVKEKRITAAIRNALPAHLVCWVVWLEPKEMEEARIAYHTWLAATRRARRARFGMKE